MDDLPERERESRDMRDLYRNLFGFFFSLFFYIYIQSFRKKRETIMQQSTAVQTVYVYTNQPVLCIVLESFQESFEYCIWQIIILTGWCDSSDLLPVRFLFFLFFLNVRSTCQIRLICPTTCHLCYCGNVELNTDAKSDFVNTTFCGYFFPFPERDIIIERIHSGRIEKIQIYITMMSALHPTHKVYELQFYVEIVWDWFIWVIAF